MFPNNYYINVLRPDVILLKNYPHDPKFSQSKFWSIAQDYSGNKIVDGYKMKWHHVGNGKEQLRLSVGMFNEAFLCEAYIKHDAKYEKRQLAKFKVHLQLIRQNGHIVKGRL
jgi:hypothetical protein